MTKSLPLKSAMVLGNLVLPQTNLKKSDLSSFVNSSNTSQNQVTRDEFESIPVTQIIKKIYTSGNLHLTFVGSYRFQEWQWYIR
jgi:hypothetical protein